MTGYTNSSTFVPTEEELGLVAQIYERAGCSRPGYIEGEIVAEIFSSSTDLEPSVLSAIWDLADGAKSGYLSETGVAVALRLIGWAQSGEEVNADLENTIGPLAQIKSPANDVDWPAFTDDERDASLKLFEECGPVYGLLEGDKARDALLVFDLAPKDIWKIWEIADTRKRGALDKYEFALAIYIIQGVQSGRLASIPPTTPPQIFEQIRANMPLSPRVPPPPTSPQILETPIRPQRPTRPPPPSTPVLPIPPRVESPVQSPTWDISPMTRATAEEHFDVLDSSKVGYIEGDVVAQFMLGFQLIPEDLALIWDLADLDNDQRLTRDEFVIAMHLIEQRLGGAELPYILPPTMIPPSLRAHSTNTPLKRSATSPTSKKIRATPRSYNGSASESPPLPPKPGFSQLNYRHSVAVSETKLPKTPKSPLTRWNSRHSVAAPTVTEIHVGSLPAEPSEPEQKTVSLEQYRTLEQENLRLTSKVEELSAKICAQGDPFIEGEYVTLEQYHELEEENYRLSSNIKDLSSQVAAQRGLQGQIDTLSRDNTELLSKISDMEQITSEVLQSNDTYAVVDKLETSNRELRLRIVELEQVQPRLEDTTRRLENALQENKDLSFYLRQAREAAEADSELKAEQHETMRQAMEVLEHDNQALRNRADDLQRSISKAANSSGPLTNPQEMEILMGDVTRENEKLKHRLRQMENSAANLLLSNGGHAEQEGLRRTNQRLTSKVEELEQLIEQLQKSSEEDELQRVLQDVTMENGELKGSLREMRLEVTQLQQTARQVDPLKTEVEQLKAEIRRLHVENARAQPQEASSVPPPAYEDFH